MSFWIGVIVAIPVVLVLVLAIARRAGKGVDPTQLLFDPELIGRVKALAQADHKIAAIKMLRDSTPGLGLTSAKQMVDRMVAPPRITTSETVPAPAAPNLAESGMTASEMMPSASDVPLEVELRVRSMKATGQKISAIKLVREHTSCGLREAKEYVDGLT